MGGQPDRPFRGRRQLVAAAMVFGARPGFEVQGRRIPEVAHKNAVLFLWCTSPTLVRALDILTRWDFEYRASAVWVKDKIGLGFTFRNKHELLLVG